MCYLVACRLVGITQAVGVDCSSVFEENSAGEVRTLDESGLSHRFEVLYEAERPCTIDLAVEELRTREGEGLRG